MPKSYVKTIEALHAAALSLPGASEGVACAGTKLERRTAIVNGKAFLFTGAADLRFKLDASLEAAMECADAVSAGSGGWAIVRFDMDAKPPSASTLRKWIAESHGLFAKHR